MQEPRYYDIRHVRGSSTHIDIDNGVVESAGTSFFDTALIRVLGPKGWGIYTVDNYDPDSGSLERMIGEATRLAEITQEKVELAPVKQGMIGMPACSDSPVNYDIEEKSRMLSGIENAAKLPGIINTRAQYSESERTVTFSDSSGNEFGYEMIRNGFTILAVASQNGNMQMGRERFHTINGFSLKGHEEMGRKAAGTALALLDAVPAKGGKMIAVLDPELAGVFAHEAVGHASEGDLVKEGVSVLKGHIGEKIGSPAVTIVDDPTLPHWGFMPVDDEGTAVQRTLIIEKGVLRNFMHSRETLAAVGDGIAGHARGESGMTPVVRMSNTFIENGDSDFDEIISECRDGIYLKGSRGGQVDPGRGVFQFNAEYGYIVKNGECREMVRDVSLSGDILQTLHDIALAGDDLTMNAGFCGKSGQTMPVSDGSPHVLLKNAVVGGHV
jgi:TldD protein